MKQLTLKPTKASLAVLTLLMALSLLGVAGGAGAQTFTATHTDNFDADAAGSIAPGFVNIGSSSYKVTAAQPVSSPNAFGEPSATDGDLTLYTGGAAQANQFIYTSELVSSSTNTGYSGQFPVFCADATGTNFYMVQQNVNNGTFTVYQHGGAAAPGGTFTSLGSGSLPSGTAAGSILKRRAWILNGVIHVRYWLSPNSEPATEPTFTVTTALAAGYAGLREAVSSGTPVGYADDFAVGTASLSVVTGATSASIHKSFLQWHPSSANAAEMETNTSGAWTECVVSGTTSVSEQFDTASPVVSGAALRWAIDGGPLQTGTVAASVSLATGLSTSSHDVKVWLPYLVQTSDRWVTPASVTRLISVTTDSGSVVSAPAGLPASGLLVYSDSRGEGAIIADATAAWPYLLGQALGMETGVRSFGSMGWASVNGTAAQTGSIVPFFTSGNDAQSSWNKYDSTHSLLTAGQFTQQPGMIVGCFGINDTRLGTSDSAVSASVSGWLTAVRAAVMTGVPVLIVQDFSGDKQAAVLSGFNAYQSATPDAKAYLVPISVIPGLNDLGASAISSDGAHPTLQGQAIVAAKIVQAIQAKITPAKVLRRIN